MDWKLTPSIQCWIRIAQTDNQGKVSAFEYSANTILNTRDARIEFIRKGSKGFRKVWRAYFA